MANVVVVGAGIVGLCCARSLLAEGHAVTVVDPQPEGDKASFGNAGGIAVTEIVPASNPSVFARLPGWLLDPLGPIAVKPRHMPKLLPFLWRFARSSTEAEIERITEALAALMVSADADVTALLEDVELTRDLARAGALWVYSSRSAFERDAAERELRRRYGIVLDEMDGSAARALEPALGPRVTHAVYAPHWSHLADPRRLLLSLQRKLVGDGVTFARARATGISDNILICSDSEITFDHLVVAAGVWSGQLAKAAGDRVLLESERGYNMTLPAAGVEVERELIFAEHACVATPMDMGLRIGGAAEFGGLNTQPNFARSGALARQARTYLPALDISGGTAWAGHRPATPDSLPVIGRSPRRHNVLYAFGHGHCGLTLAPTTGRLIADLVAGRTSPIALEPYSISRFQR